MPVLAANEHGDRLGGDAPDLLVNLLHRAAVADERLSLCIDLADLDGLHGEPAAGQRPVHERDHLGHLKGLQQVVVSPEFRRLDRDLAGAVGGHHDDGQAWPRLGQFLKKLQARESGSLKSVRTRSHR